MSATPRISIAMATYNGARYIREQLDSLAAQTLLPYELVVSDDGSTDSTLDIVRDFALDAPFPVRVYRNEKRLGYADNFLSAASLCEGELIAFCDQDDVWMPKKLATCADIFEDPDVLLVIHSAVVTGSDLKHTGTFYPDIEFVNKHQAKQKKKTGRMSSDQLMLCKYDSLQLDPMDVYPGFSMIFRKIVVNIFDRCDRGKDYQFYRANPPMISHDRWIYLMCCSLGKVVLTEEKLSLYRQHESNTCGLSGPRSLWDQLKSYFSPTVYEGRYRNELHWVNVMEEISKKNYWSNKHIASNAINASKFFERCRDKDNALIILYSLDSSWSKRLTAYLYLVKNFYLNSAESCFVRHHPVKDFLFGLFGFYSLYRKTKIILMMSKGKHDTI